MKKIKFAAQYPFIDLPTSGKNFIPDWYKSIPNNLERSKFRLAPDNTDLGTLKRCVPFLDALMGGYMATLWQDVQIKQVDGHAQINWPTAPAVMDMRQSHYTTGFEPPAGYSSKSYAWISPFVIETPPGYSLLLTHPLNRFDLPFMTTSGIVDSDGILHQGNIPFFLKEGFEGTIPRGTPIFQIIPFKRDDWTSEQDGKLKEKGSKRHYDSMSVLNGWYKNKIWKKKSFEDGIKNA